MSTAASQTNVTELPDMGRINEVFARQQAQALRLRKSTAAERIQRLKRLRQAVEDHRQAIYEAAHADFRKTRVEVDTTEILPVIAECNHAIRHLKGWMKPRRVLPTTLMMGTSAWVQYQPKGVALIISPWNFPINLTLCPLISAIAAGCTAIIKPSELTPEFSAVMTRIINEIYSPDEVAIFEGDARLAQALLDLPFDHIFFTGSPEIGKVVMTAAAKNLASVTLELGGKSPTIVDPSANLQLAARNIMYGKFTNNGQICIAPDYLFVHESVKDEFIAECRKVIALYYGETHEEQVQSPNYARVVNERHTGRVRSLIEDATERGARILTGGNVSDEDCFIQPTLIDQVPEGARILEEEIFGPVAPILEYRDIDEVIDHINAGHKPLALYIWSNDDDTIRRVMEETSSGGACINHTLVHFLHGRLPFGGVNNSGIGSCHGHHGFLAFSHERAVVRTRFMMARMLFPPYNMFKLLFIKLTQKLV